MGWCSGTVIFDDMARFVLAQPASDDDKFATLRALAVSLQNEDWDCESDSRYYNHPIVQRVMKDLHPDWFEEE